MTITILSNKTLIHFMMNGAEFTTTKALKTAVCIKPNAIYAGGKYQLNQQTKDRLNELLNNNG